MEVTYRFKGLDLIDRELEKLWMEACNIVGGSDQNHPQEINAKRQTGYLMMPLKIAEKRKEAKGKGE